MHPLAAEGLLKVVRLREREGDRPTNAALSVETLEDCLLEIAQQRDRLAMSSARLDEAALQRAIEAWQEADMYDINLRAKIERVLEAAGSRPATPPTETGT